MWVNGYIKWKTNDLIPHKFLFKHGKIQEVENENFKGIKAFENNSDIADNIEIFKTYKRDLSNKHSRHFIKNSKEDNVFLIFLKINQLQYWQLQWQLKEWLIQSKDFKLEILKYLVVALLAYLIGKLS